MLFVELIGFPVSERLDIGEHGFLFVCHLLEKYMKFELMGSDWPPSIEVVRDGDELVAQFWGFTGEEAERWYNSEVVMESLDIWHSVLGDFDMTVNIHSERNK